MEMQRLLASIISQPGFENRFFTELERLRDERERLRDEREGLGEQRESKTTEEKDSFNLMIDLLNRNRTREQSLLRQRELGSIRRFLAMHPHIVNISVTLDDGQQLSGIGRSGFQEAKTIDGSIREFMQQGRTRLRSSQRRTSHRPGRNSGQDFLIVIPSVERQREICPICISELGTERTFVLPCLHHLHVNCLEPWLENHSTCPVCRLNLESNLSDNSYGYFLE